MDLDDDSWYVVRNTPGVTGFVGSGASPPRSRARKSRTSSASARSKRRRGRREEGAAAPRVRGGRAGAGHHRSVRRFQRCDHRDRRRPLEAQGAREHLRSRDPRRARVRPTDVPQSSSENKNQYGQDARSLRSSRSRSRPAGNAGAAGRTALGPHGINIMDFCKAYNAATENQRGTVIPAEITIYEDRTFTFVTKTPPTPVLLQQAAGIEKGSEHPRHHTVGARHQGAGAPDRRNQDARPQRHRPRRRDEAGRGTARSMGIDVTD